MSTVLDNGTVLCGCFKCGDWAGELIAGVLFTLNNH